MGHYADDVVLVADLGAELQAMLDVVETCVARGKTKFNSIKSKVMVVGKREAGVSWKIGEEEIEEFKYFGVWVDRKLPGNIQVREDGKKAEELIRRWRGWAEWMDRWK